MTNASHKRKMLLELNQRDKVHKINMLKSIQGLIKEGGYHTARRLAAIVLISDIRVEYYYRKKISRLEPTGEFEKVMIIGTNPGEASTMKDLWGDPFGIHLKGLFDRASVSIDEVYMTNLYKGKTPGNRPLTKEEAEIGFKELKAEIDLVDPKKIVCFGKIVCDMMGAERGKENKYKNIPMMGTYHPSYLRRVPSLEGEFINHLSFINNE